MKKTLVILAWVYGAVFLTVLLEAGSALQAAQAIMQHPIASVGALLVDLWNHVAALFGAQPAAN